MSFLSNTPNKNFSENGKYANLLPEHCSGKCENYIIWWWIWDLNFRGAKKGGEGLVFCSFGSVVKYIHLHVPCKCKQTLTKSHRNVLINACLHLFTCSNLLFLYSVNLLWEKVNLLSYVRHKEGVYNKYWFIHTYIYINDSIRETEWYKVRITLGFFFPHNPI